MDRRQPAAQPSRAPRTARSRAVALSLREEIEFLRELRRALDLDSAADRRLALQAVQAIVRAVQVQARLPATGESAEEQALRQLREELYALALRLSEAVEEAGDATAGSSGG